ncbi:DUF5709 domain-containing protein [Rhodococcus sp. X156]|uniref:DUF5709 domain-containing protein n=1 Tax=Rhodococcus sp. X156 TaxID=2499145 RepID=UPI000FDB394B|nr:DUF5709 domain-containing protein [Rhodococcus sp. X156]
MTGPESFRDEGDSEYSLDPEDQLPQEDTLLYRGVDDALDEGYSPPEYPRPEMRPDSSPTYERDGSATMDELLAEEVPDPAAEIDEPLDRNDQWRSDVAERASEFPRDEEVGSPRSGRLVAPDEGVGPDLDAELFAEDVGIDGSAASAEEAAVHVIDEDATD